MERNETRTEWESAVIAKAIVDSAKAPGCCAMCGSRYHADWVLPDRTVKYCPAWKMVAAKESPPVPDRPSNWPPPIKITITGPSDDPTVPMRVAVKAVPMVCHNDSTLETTAVLDDDGHVCDDDCRSNGCSERFTDDYDRFDDERYNLGDEGRNDDGTGESYAERNA